MTNELVNADLEAVVGDVKSRGVVMVRADGRTVLAGPYQWKAAVSHLVDDHIRKAEQHGEWCTLDCFARFLESRATEAAKERARDRIAPLAAELLTHGEFLIIDYSGPGGAKSAMRILLSSDDPDVTAAQINRMVQMRDTTTEKARLMLSIIDAKRKLLAEPPPESSA